MASRNALASAEFGGESADIVSEELAKAWEADPRCAECGDPVPSVLDAALLVGPNRVTHKERCFIPALVRGHPHLKLLTVRQRTKEETTRTEHAGGATELPLAHPEAFVRESNHG
jgi:hypothetical protein